MRKYLLVLAISLISVTLCSCGSLQRNADGTASPTGKAVVQAADAGQAGLNTLSTAPGVVGLIATLASVLAGYGVKRLHDKLDDITPETPVITTTPSK